MKKLAKMKKLTNIGIGRVELMVCLCAILVLLAVGIVYLSDSSAKGNLNMFKKVGDAFAYEVSIYKDQYPRADDKYYLDYLLDHGLPVEVNNPTNTGESCDRYQSYVEIDENGKKKVVMKCGIYYVEGMHENTYKVYEVTDWSEDSTKATETEVLYNYMKDGKEASSVYMLENEFVDFYNENEGTSIFGAYEVEEGKLLSKDLYRKKTFIKKID